MICHTCDGTGRVTTWATDGRELYEAAPEPCDACLGRGTALCASCYEETAITHNPEGQPLCAECANWERGQADTEPAPAPKMGAT